MRSKGEKCEKQPSKHQGERNSPAHTKGGEKEGKRLSRHQSRDSPAAPGGHHGGAGTSPQAVLPHGRGLPLGDVLGLFQPQPFHDPMERPIAEQGSALQPMARTTAEQVSTPQSVKDPLLKQVDIPRRTAAHARHHTEAEEKCEEEGAAGRTCYGLTTTPHQGDGWAKELE